MNSSTPAQPVRVFISYRHANHSVLDELRDHLGWLENSDQIKVFDDRDILAGDEWDARIKAELEQARIIVLIVTAKFMRSPYCTKVELRSALEQGAREGTRIIPIIAEACDWEAMPIFKTAGLPKDKANNLKPLNKWRGDKDVALTQIAQQVRRNVERLTTENQLPKNSRDVLNNLRYNVNLTLISPTVTDQTKIHEAFKRFGVNWPPVKIEWPSSADELINTLRQALEQFDAGAADLDGATHFGANVPRILAQVAENRRRAEAIIPAMVRRLRNLKENDRTDCVAGFLLYANLRVHTDANYYASWDGLKTLGMEVPRAWIPLRGDKRLAVALGKPEEELVTALLVRVAGVDIYNNGSQGLYISLPKRYAAQIITRPYELPPSVLYWWGVPQLEYATLKQLPEMYSEDWRFSKLSCSDEQEMEKHRMTNLFR